MEAGLFGVTALQPNILLILFMIMQVVVTGSMTLVSREMMEEEEAMLAARNICAKIWRIYGEVNYRDDKSKCQVETVMSLFLSTRHFI